VSAENLAMQEKEGNTPVSFPTLQVLDVGGATSDSCTDSLPVHDWKYRDEHIPAILVFV